MALARPTLTLIFIYAILFFALYCKPTSSHGNSDAPTPKPSQKKEKKNESDSESPSDTPTPSSGPTTDSPLSISELFELSLPEIGVQKASAAKNTEGTKVTNTQLEGIEHRIDEFKSILTKKLADPKTSAASKKCLDQCQENLEDAIDGVKMSIESINKQDLAKANVDISGVATDIETCNDCFIETTGGEDKEVKAFNVWVKGVMKECLNNLKKI